MEDLQEKLGAVLHDPKAMEQIMAMEEGLKKYMLHTVGAISMNTMMFCCSGGDDAQRRQAYQAFWAHTAERDLKLSRHIRTRSYPAFVCWMPWKMRGWVLLTGYKILCKINKLG